MKGGERKKICIYICIFADGTGVRGEREKKKFTKFYFDTYPTLQNNYL